MVDISDSASDPLTKEVLAFQASVSAPTPFNAVADIIADGGSKAAVYADELNTRGRQPLSFEALRTCLAERRSSTG